MNTSKLLAEIVNGMVVCAGPVGQGEFINVPAHALEGGPSTFVAIFDDQAKVWYVGLKAVVVRVGIRAGEVFMIPRRVFGGSRAEAVTIARQEEEREVTS